MKNMRIYGKPLRDRGFTLIELLVTVAIIAILSTIALTSYRAQVIKSRRAAAAVCLQERAQFMERYFSTRLSYIDAELRQCDENVSEYYTIAFSEGPTARAFTLSATPEGSQETDDTKCATLTVNEQGTRTSSGSGTLAECW
jgi:type IV pilus assembly protein PilE